MAGVVLETLSNRKLIAFGVIALLVQIGFFLIGGLIAPAPNNVQTLLSNICIDKTRGVNHENWIYPRGNGSNCVQVQADELYRKPADEVYSDLRKFDPEFNGDDLVFVFQFPLPRDGLELYMSKLHQSMVSVASMHITYHKEDPKVVETTMTLDSRLAYRENSADKWTEIARSTEVRPLNCRTNDDTQDEYEYDCDMVPLFELGSVHTSQYLVNIRLPTYQLNSGNLNEGLGALKEIHVIVIHPNGGFTLVWFCIKTLVFPIIVVELLWFIWRVSHLERKPNILEQTLIAVGSALTLLNIPVDWLTLWIHMPFMVLYSDIRQGIFYSVLLCFWVIFAGEHMMDQMDRNHIVHYWKDLSAVGFGCICLFVFEMCERGVQLTNPFYSIWATNAGRNLGLTFVILAGLSACIYFFYLLWMVVRVCRNIVAKKSALPSMSKPRRNFYMNLIYRFSFLMAFTMLCAAMTIILFIIGQVSEGYWKWGDERSKIQYTSAVQTGVYGMWNIYVFCLLIFYAPSTKYVAVAAEENSAEETVEFSTIPSEVSALASFVQKTTVD